MNNRLTEKILLYKVIKQKDSQAFGQLYDRYIERIYRFVYFKVSNKEEAEDLTSDVFLKTWHYLVEGSDKKIDSFSGLVYRIARNRIVDLYRERSRKPECAVDLTTLEIAVDDETLAKIDTQQSLDHVFAELKKLKQEYQEIVFLRYVEDLSTAEIARILGKKNTAVRVTLHRALKKLKDLLDHD